MEKYSLEQAQKESIEIKKRAREIKNERIGGVEKVGEPEAEDYEMANKSIEHERFLGLHEDVEFENAIKSKLLYKHSPETTNQIKNIFQKNRVDIDPGNIHHVDFYSTEHDFNEKDWENIRRSSIPLVTLYAALHFHSLREQNSKKERHVFFEDLRAKALLRSFPLIHGTSMKSFLDVLKSGKIISNKDLYKKKSEDNPEDIFENKEGKTNIWDRKLGLDQYVFADFGRPHMYHKQEEITLVLDPVIINSPGTFMTEMDIADCTGDNKIGEYLRSVSTPEYFYDTALMRINKTKIADREVRRGGAYESEVTYNTVDKFMSGMDGDRNNFGQANFSTWEVKLSEVPVDAIKRVVVRNEDDFNYLKDRYSSLFEIVYESELKPVSKPTDESGNYNVLKIPGAFEKQLENIMEDEYKQRVETLDKLPTEEKEHIFVVFPGTKWGGP